MDVAPLDENATHALFGSEHATDKSECLDVDSETL